MLNSKQLGGMAGAVERVINTKGEDKRDEGQEEQPLTVDS